MIANGPTTVLSSTPGRRMTSRSSLPTKEPMRTRLPIRILAVGPCATLADELGEHLVEGRLVLLEPGHTDAGDANRLDDARRQDAGIRDRRGQRSRAGLAHVLDAGDVGEKVGVDRA